jgi:GNAT superfamily N-acetyltransferase
VTAIRIRPAEARELAALGELKLRASLAWGDHLEALASMPEARTVPPEHLPFLFVAEAAGRILGFATVLAGPGPEAAVLEDLFVEPDAWRQGVGRGLVLEAERRARALGAASLQVIAGRARGFYGACGFAVTGRADTRLEPAVEMELPLAAGDG